MTNFNATRLDDSDGQCCTTKLYGLLPIGVATPRVESLTSYVCRLAEAHCISTGALISKMIIPRLNKPYLDNLAARGGTRLYSRSHALNGAGEMAKSWYNVLEILTGRNDLINLTWRPWRGLVPPRELLKQVRCWCSACFDEQVKEGHPVYEPLLWTARCITSCAIHGAELVSTCPHCGWQMHVLERRTTPGRCSKCNSWLGEHPNNLKGTYEVRHLPNQLVGQLLATQTDMNQTRKPICETLSCVVNRLYHGNVAATARDVQIPKTTFWGWSIGINLPTLEQTIHICTRFDLNLVDFFRGNIDESVSECAAIEIPSAGHRRRKQRPLDLTSLKHDLERFVHEPQSLRCVACTLGVDQRTLRNHFPDICAKISAGVRNSVYMRSQSRKKVLVDSVRQATITLHELAIYPSRRRVETLLNSPGALREQPAKAAWHDTLSSIGLRFDKTSYQIDETSE